MSKYCTDDGTGKVALIVGTKCSELECRELGCCFPDCAELGTVYDSFEQARNEVPDLEKV